MRKTGFLNRYTAILFLVLWGFSASVSAAVTYCAPSAFGYSTATGGGSATPVLVSSVSQLQNALNKGKNKVIIITQDLTFTTCMKVQDGSNVTLMGLPGVTLTSLQQDKTNSGILYVKRFNNLIIRNLTFVGPGAYDCDGWDLLCFENVTNAWVDHCDFQDGCDGNFDNKAGTDNVTVSWCRFRYLKAPKSGGSGGTADHRFTNLLGSSSSDAPSDGTYNFTWAYCWWDNGCKERMIRCRNAELHFLNCYWNSSVASYYVGPENAKAYFEGCTFEGKANTKDKIFKSYGGTNACKFVDCSGNLPGNSGTVSTPSYTYTASGFAEAKTAVTNATCGAGATLTVTTAGAVSSSCDGGAPLPTVYTVTWDAATNSGSCGTASTQVTDGAAIGTLPDATKEGYNFDGWYTLPSGGTKINSTTTVTSNVTYYAQFTSAPVTVYYTVIWDANGGTCATASSTIESGQAIGTLPDATKAGDYTFDGWYTAINGGTKILTTTTVSSNVTYYAHYTATGGGGGGDCSITLTHFGKQVRTSAPRRGFAYVGSTSGTKYIIESNSSDVKNIDNDSSAIRLPYSNKFLKVLGPGATTDIEDSLFTEVTQISFKWKYAGSTSNYTTDLDVLVGGVKVATKTLTGNKNDDYATATISSIASKNGAVKIINKGSSSSNQKFDIDDITITYTCSGSTPPPASYTLSYDENGGKGEPMEDQVGTSLTVATNTYTLTGYAFQKWSTSRNGGGVDYAAGDPITLTEDVTLYAIWQAQSYTVTFDKQSGDGGSASVTATFDESMPDITIPSRAGYIFKGYYSEEDGGGTQYYDENGSSTNAWNKPTATTLYAYWEAGSITPVSSDLHFWFFNTADATANGKTNDATMFAGMVSDASNMAGSITIDGTSYSVTRRTGDHATFGSFTIPSGYTGIFYALAVSSGGGDRQINLVGATQTYELDVPGGSDSYKRLESEELPAGTYSIERDGTSNVRLSVVIVKLITALPPSAAPTISDQPDGATYCAGDVVSALSVTATGSGTVTYQWKKDGVAIPSAEANTYEPTESGTYLCVVTNTEEGKAPNSLNSDEAVVTINGTIAAPMMSQTDNTVNIATATAGATIYYTTNGSDPTTSSASGTSVTISESCTVKAYAVKDGCESTVTSFAATYVASCPKWVGAPDSWTGSKITVGLLELETSDASKTAISSSAVWSGHNETVTAISGSNVYVQGHLTDGAELGTITISAANNQSTGDYNYVIIFCVNSSFSSGVTGETWAAPSYTDAQDNAKLVHSFTAPIGAKYFRIYRKVDAIGGYAGGGDGKTTRIYCIEACPVVTYMVTYKVNGGTGADVVDDTRVVGELPSTFTAPDGTMFDHWNTAPDNSGISYDPGDAVTSDLTLYAQWVNYYTVTFDLQGHGDAIAPYSPVAYNTTISAPANPSASGWSFGGWYKEPSCTNAWDFANDKVTANTTLYAKWTESVPINAYLLQGINAAGTEGTGTLTGDFYTGASLGQTVDVSYDGVSYTKGIKFGGNASGMGSYPDRIVRYDCKSTKTEFTIIVYNNNSSAKDVKMGHILENAIGSVNTVSSFSAQSAASKVKTVFNYTVNNPNATPASFYVGVSSTDVYLVQIIAEEQGTLLPVPGSIGYKLNFNKTRLVARQGDEEWLDDEDFKFLPNSNVTAGSATYISIQTKGTNYIRFRTDRQATVKIGIGSNIGNGFFVSDDKDGLVNPIEFPKAGGANKIYNALVKAGTHYIVPNGSNVYVTSLELATAVTIRFNANGGLGTMKSQIVSPGEVTLDECTYLRPGYVLGGWSRNADGSGTLIPNGGTLTVAESPDEITLYAVWLDACAATPTLNKISAVLNLKDNKKVDMPVINMVCNYDTTDVHYSFVSALPAIPGCTFSFYESQVHIVGTPTIGNSTVENRTVTITLSNDCSPATTYTITQDVRITPAAARPKVAFIIDGTKEGNFNEYNSSHATACNTLVTYLESFYDVDFVNGYATKDEASIATFYNDYDVMVVTDYLETPEGYTNALGTLIDKKPILCFEAYVAGEHGKNWHIHSEPADPSPKTGTMKVTCAGHKIFSEDEGPIFNRPGGESDTTITVLESIGGKGLQGFVINEAPDFVFLGTVRDANNNRDLIVCCERQVVFQARLMMYCINYNDMNRLTTAGKIVMHQMIEYLLSTDETKAADCSLVFDNGAGNTTFNPSTYTGTGTKGDGKWSTAANWGPGYNILPSPYDGARITAECHVDIPNAHAGNVKLNMGKDEFENPVHGKLIIEPSGGLLVAGMVKKVNDTRYASPLVTKAEDVLIKADENNNGALVFGNKESDVYATVQYYSRAYGAKVGNPVWQYIGIPLQAGKPAIDLYPEAWMCRWSTESDGSLGGQWQWVNKYDILLPFESYCITQDVKKTYTFVGKLNEPLDKTILLTERDEEGYAFAANSWTAPIKIQEMLDDDFINAERSIYIYHSGSYNDWKGYSDAGTDAVSSKTALASPGQYSVIPIHSSPYLSGADSVIPAMQGFVIKTTAPGAKLVLDYSRVVYDSKTFRTSTQPMRAPKHTAADSDAPDVMQVFVSGNSYGDRVYLLARTDFSEAYEDGWDGRKIDGDSDAPKLAVVKEGGEMAVAAIPTAEERLLSFRAGMDSIYTFSFVYEGEPLYLYDLLAQRATRIQTGNTYVFEARNRETASQRFLITANPPHQVVTEMETISSEESVFRGVRKVIMDGQLYILRGDRVYDAVGRSVSKRKEAAR